MDLVTVVRLWTLVLVLVSCGAFVAQTALMWHSIGLRRVWLCIALVLWQLGGAVGLVGRIVQHNAPLGWGLPLVWAASLAVLYAVIRGHVWKDEA